jgi:hypothetical protein
VEQKYLDEMASHLAVMLNPDPATAMIEQSRLALFLSAYWKDKIAVVRTFADVRERCHLVPSDEQCRNILRSVLIEAEESELLDDLIDLYGRETGLVEGEIRQTGPASERAVSVLTEEDDDLDY